MIDTHPMMSPQLLSDVEDYYNKEDCVISADSIMVRYWDEVSAAVITMSEMYGLTPRHVIEEFCTDSDFPTDPNQL